MSDIFPRNYATHFALLAKAVFLLKNIATEGEICTAESLLLSFVQQSARLYEESVLTCISRCIFQRQCGCLVLCGPSCRCLAIYETHLTSILCIFTATNLATYTAAAFILTFIIVSTPSMLHLADLTFEIATCCHHRRLDVAANGGVVAANCIAKYPPSSNAPVK